MERRFIQKRINENRNETGQIEQNNEWNTE